MWTRESSNSVWALGAGDGQAVVIHPAENEFVIVGYRCQLSITTPMAQWPALKRVHVEKGRVGAGRVGGPGRLCLRRGPEPQHHRGRAERAGSGVHALVTCGPFAASGSSRQKKNTDKHRWGG